LTIRERRRDVLASFGAPHRRWSMASSRAVGRQDRQDRHRFFPVAVASTTTPARFQGFDQGGATKASGLEVSSAADPLPGIGAICR